MTANEAVPDISASILLPFRTKKKVREEQSLLQGRFFTCTYHRWEDGSGQCFHRRCRSHSRPPPLRGAPASARGRLRRAAATAMQTGLYPNTPRWPLSPPRPRRLPQRRFPRSPPLLST